MLFRSVVTSTTESTETETTATEPSTTETEPSTTTRPQYCVSEDVQYEIGAEWTPEDEPCLTCYCDEDGVSCHDESTVCDLTCDGELVHVEGECCPVCKPKENPCEVGSTTEVITVDECVSAEAVEMTSCAGTCASSFMVTAYGVSSDCKCCKPATSEKFTVTLNCADGSTKQHEVMRITACACDACAYDPYGPSQQDRPVFN